MAILNACHVFEIERQGQWMQIQLPYAKRIHAEILPHRLIRDRCGEYHHQNEHDRADPYNPTCDERTSRRRGGLPWLSW